MASKKKIAAPRCPKCGAGLYVRRTGIGEPPPAPGLWLKGCSKCGRFDRATSKEVTAIKAEQGWWFSGTRKRKVQS